MRSIPLLLFSILPIVNPSTAYPSSQSPLGISPRSPPRTVSIVPPRPPPPSKSPVLNFWPFASNRKSKWTKGRPQIDYHDYDNQVVLRFNISSLEEEAAFRARVDRMLIDVWDYTLNYTDIRIPKRRIVPFLDGLPDSLREAHMIMIPDLARAVAATYPSTFEGDTEFETALRQRSITENTNPEHFDRRKQSVDNLFFKDYQPMFVISRWMRLIESMFSSGGFVRMFSIGKSWEGQDIPALRVGLPSGTSTTAKARKTILITGGLHAREWISVSTVNYLAYSFITAFGEDSLATKILEEFDLVFVPVVNPDGYEYTWNVDRLWRKSRQRTPMHLCHGFDLDHSFGYHWDASEHQEEPCSESYGGKKPFQAVEASQLADWAKNETQHGVDFVAYLDLHSYSQQILWPYAYSCDARVPNLENMQEVAMNIAKHMRLSNGEVYTVGSACESATIRQTTNADDEVRARGRRVEAAGGSAVDFFHHDLKARYSYQIKLRDTGSYGFLLPSDYIVPVGQEVFAAMKYFGDYLLGNNGIERGNGFMDAEAQRTMNRAQT